MQPIAFLPFLFALLSVYSTFRFASLYYSRRTAWLSALVLASCQAMFLITHDVRTDTMLMGWVIFGIWQMSEMTGMANGIAFFLPL